ncbi:CIC11C00000000259 [Sungouiella intermedia]|uniref:Methylated-DNA--protein-cysteine methyltransferase n=1 Tax=Sungouiella intermedia TaxID=45354 RepID=A0A1L0C0G6_9ASCO|nr:CIC11C00000000259 [[Candida] intermedia]
MRSKRLYYWVLHLKAQDGLAVIDLKGVVSYLSIGRWNTLVDLVKRDFRTAKMENYLLPGNEKVTNDSIESTKRVLEQMLDNPSEIDSLRRTINYEVIFGTELQRKVWTYLVDHIPVGTTSSYSEVAKALGVKSARVVGNACGANRIALIIPCHRVLTAQGTINGYRYGKDEKERLLQLEVKK